MLFENAMDVLGTLKGGKLLGAQEIVDANRGLLPKSAVLINMVSLLEGKFVKSAPDLDQDVPPLQLRQRLYKITDAGKEVLASS